MSELHAATALAVLDGFDAVLAARGRLAERYRAALASAEVAVQAGGRHSTWQFVPVLAADAAMREEVLRAAREAEIQLRTYHEPLHLMPPLRRHRTIGPLDVTCDLAQRSLSLPLANDMSDEEVERVCALVASPDRLAVR
jgi:dTDP-4-amino-4,6-dideoxygalactose transaminase